MDLSIAAFSYCACYLFHQLSFFVRGLCRVKSHVFTSSRTWIINQNSLLKNRA
jgi:hypothetical protein